MQAHTLRTRVVSSPPGRYAKVIDSHRTHAVAIADKLVAPFCPTNYAATSIYQPPRIFLRLLAHRIAIRLHTAADGRQCQALRVEGHNRLVRQGATAGCH